MLFRSGIPPSALDRLFDKFFRADFLRADLFRADDGDRRRTGTGLGLAIAKGFIEAQLGRISARNRRDRQGAEFVIRYRVAP